MNRKMRRISVIITLRWVAVAFCLCLPIGTASAGQVRVTPSDKIEFDHNVKFSMMTLTNEGRGPITLDISSVEWDQDADGGHIHVEPQDLVVAPRVMTLDEGEQRILRVGYRGKSSARERTYRVLIAERSGGATGETGRRPSPSPVTVPVFIKPAEERVLCSLRAIALSEGDLTFEVNHAGNAHLLVLSVGIRGAASDHRELFARELAGSYVLGGRSKFYRTAVPGPLCRKLSRLNVHMKTNAGLFSGGVDVRPGMCGP